MSRRTPRGTVRLMRLTILGGGGFRVPLVYGALLDDARRGGPDSPPPRSADVTISGLVLHDTDAGRLTAIGNVLAAMAKDHPKPVPVHTTTDLDEALRGADFVDLGTAAILHPDFPRRATADDAFASDPLPVTRERLEREHLGPAFIDYLAATWGSDFVVQDEQEASHA